MTNQIIFNIEDDNIKDIAIRIQENQQGYAFEDADYIDTQLEKAYTHSELTGDKVTSYDVEECYELIKKRFKQHNIKEDEYIKYINYLNKKLNHERQEEYILNRADEIKKEREKLANIFK